MLFVPGTDAENQPIGLQNILLAEYFLSLLTLPVGTENFSRNGLAAFFGEPAGGGIHLQQYPALVGGFIFGVTGVGGHQHKTGN